MPTSPDRSIVARHPRQRRGRPPFALVGVLAAAAIAAAPTVGAPEQQPKRGGTVVVAVGAEPPCVNPVVECGIGAGVYGCAESNDVTGYCQRLVTADLKQADQILNEEQRAHVLNRADRRLALDVPVIPLYQPPAILAFRATIRNIRAFDLEKGENWWLDD